MVDPQVIVKANYNRTLVTVRVTAINSPDWADIVGTRLELFYDSGLTNRFVNNTTTHYKVRAYLENEAPNTTIYGQVTLTKNDNTTRVSTFNFVIPYPVLGTVKDDNSTQYITSIRKIDSAGNLSPRDYTNRAMIANDGAEYIDIKADEDGNMIVANQWTTPVYTQNITRGATKLLVNASSERTVPVSRGDIVRVTESNANNTFKSFQYYSSPLCKGVSAHITRMPSMNKFCRFNNGTRPDAFFFYAFNDHGTLTSLPDGSFDTRKLTTLNTYSFAQFNYYGALTSLPDGSFDTSGITDFTNSTAFQQFNGYGALTSLPEGSFDFDNLTTAYYEFQGFNVSGALTSLPEGSFGFSDSTGRLAPSLGSNFNAYGALTSLPAGSFHFGAGAKAGGTSCFASFNNHGSITSLPDYSFNFLIEPEQGTSQVGFGYFNSYGALTSLPAGSFRFSPLTTSLSASSFRGFNSYGALTSLPAGSFNTDNLTTLGFMSFCEFNSYGALTSLPENSFNFDNVTDLTGQSVLRSFNAHGALQSLPKGSFSFKNLASFSGLSGYNGQFASAFNAGGNLEYLPVDAFSVDGLGIINDNTSLSNFNSDSGKLVKSDTEYNVRFVNVQYLALNFDYYNPDTQTYYYDNISSGNPPKYYQADVYTITYSTSSSYSTDLGHEYLSGRSVTFTATSTDPGYVITPTLVTEGGVTVPVTNNGNNTFTFTMPQDNVTATFALTIPPSYIILTASEAGTMVVKDLWNQAVTVENLTQGTSPVTITRGNTTNVSVNANDEVKVTESSPGTTFRNWGNVSPFAVGVDSEVTYMPAMNKFTTDAAGTTLGNNAFAFFCKGKSSKGITALPAGSFDTSNITTFGQGAFKSFNENGKLTSLPTGSFNISNTSPTASAYGAFASFNYSGALTSLPAGSFDISGWTVLPSSVFMRFNDHGALTSLPIGSFDTGNVVTGGDTSTLNQTFEYFNCYGALTSLPTGSFNFDKLQTIGRYWGTGSHSDAGFCAHFNDNGALTSLPAGSFNFPVLYSSNESGFCAYFNNRGALTSLPTGSFTFPMLTTVREFFFRDFNCQGEITSLPAGSFDTSNITSVENGFFYNFNKQGKLTSLPTGSFDISSITSVGNDFFDAFNNSGYITSLPTGSFILNSSLTTVGDWFFAGFNGYGKITSFPTGSFDISNITSVGSNFFSGFVSGSEATSLPDGSFRIQNITSIGTNFFANFARTSKLTSLPNGSFRLNSSITSAPSNFFSDFLYQGKIASLPTGSFDTSNITTAGDYFFSGFYGETKSRISGSATLPDGSFKFNSLTTVGGNAFSNFNYQGALKTLPIASFGMHSLTSAGNNFCYGFNSSGNLETLSDSSFDLRNLTTVGANFCYQFNMDGKLTYLPANSFNTNHITSAGSGFLTGFYGGEKSTTEYNPNFVNSLSSSITAYYLSGSSWSSESVASGAPLYYRQSNPWGNISYYTVAIAPSATNTLVENATIVSQTNLTDFISERLYVQGDCTVEAWYYMDSGNLWCNWSTPYSSGQQFPAQELQYQYGVEISLIDSSTYAHLTWNYTAGGIDKTSTVNTVRLTSQTEYTSLGASDKTDFDDITINGATIKWGAIKSFTFGNSPTTVPSNFLCNSGVETVDFGDVELTSISDGFLRSCTSLNCEISLPSTVTTIGNYFLSGDYNLDYPITGTNVTSVGNYCLNSCQKLNSSVSFPALVTIGNDFMHYCYAFAQSLSLNNVTTIGNNFLSQSSKFNSAVSLPNVTSIGSGFLSSCELFNSAITFPKVTSIGDSFLSYAKKYNQTTTFPSTLTSIGSSAFYYCSALNSTVSLSSAPVAIGQYFMLYCTSFNKAFTIPSSVVSIADGFMFGCKSMVSNITCSAPATVAVAGNNTFSGNSTSAAQYSTGMKLTGTYKNDWKTRFPNRTSSPYRKLVVV